MSWDRNAEDRSHARSCDPCAVSAATRPWLPAGEFAGLLPLARGTGRVLGLDLPPSAKRCGPGWRCSATPTASTPTSPSPRTSASGARPSAPPRRGRGARWSGWASPAAWPTSPVGRLSAGQKRRTALACLVARRAELWLLDEPHAGLDAAGRDELDATLRAAVAAGATVIVASHELERAGSLATRVVDVVGGQVVPGEPAA